MAKELFSIIAFSAVFLLTARSCGHRQEPPKKLEVSTIVVSADTLARLSDAIQCHVHVDFTCLKEQKYAAVNDSLLRMGLLQPDYLSISYGPLSPKTAIPSFVRQYIRDYMEMARLIRQKEKGRSQLLGELSIKTELRAAARHSCLTYRHQQWKREADKVHDSTQLRFEGRTPCHPVGTFRKGCRGKTDRENHRKAVKT